MAVVAQHAGVDQAGAAARTGARDRLPRGLVDRKEVRTVHLDGGEAESLSAADLRAADGIAARGRLGVAVVLDHEYGRQIPDLGQIVAFENSALVGAAVADE